MTVPPFPPYIQFELTTLCGGNCIVCPSGAIQERELRPQIMPPDVLNRLLGDIDDLTAKIYPFKVHRAKQPYDVIYEYLLQPKTVGEGGFWTEFDWDQALRLGSETVGLDYSGEYGFAETTMNWLITHMVVPSEQALQCNDCHGEEGRLDWLALGYNGDPSEWGGRFQMTPNSE